MEVKPLLYNGEDMEIPTRVTKQDLCAKQAYWGFEHESWHNGCLQKCIVGGRICAAVISITQEIVAKICYNESECKANIQKLARAAEFCIYLLDEVLLENDLSWEDILVSYLLRYTESYLMMRSPVSLLLDFLVFHTSHITVSTSYSVINLFY